MSNCPNTKQLASDLCRSRCDLLAEIPPRLLSTRLRFTLLACLLLSLPTISQAETQVGISNLDDIPLISWAGGGEITEEDGVCVYNNTNPDYLISITGDGPGGAFQLKNGPNTIDFEVAFRGLPGSYVVLSPGVSKDFTGANTADETCGGGTNASVRVRIPENNLRGAPRGNYEGGLTFLVAPF